MARPLRLDIPKRFYHVLSRGNERRSIFEDIGDFEKFLELMETLAGRYAVEIWTHVLMGNHYHLVVKPMESNLSRAMQWLGLAYSGYFNRRYRRSGPLFQGRFKSFMVAEEAYLKQLILYVHRNPLRAGIVERLGDYPWSSYPCLAYGRRCAGWLQREKVQVLFGGRKGFRQAVQDYSEEKENLLENLKFGVVLGGEKAAKKVRELIGNLTSREQPQVRKIRRSGDFAEEVEAIRKVLGLSDGELAELRRPVRRRNRPLRDVLIYLAWKDSQHTLSAIGEYFGVHYSTIPNARSRGEENIRGDRKLRARLKGLVD